MNETINTILTTVQRQYTELVKTSNWKRKIIYTQPEN